MDKKGKPIFEQDITATTTRLKDLVSIKGISKTGCLQDASFSYLELLGRTLQEEGAYVQ